ncbi:MAG: ABC transporter permease [Gammaproteobacteria bacterium]|nr:ABC transporter permease [Gammaproteobacteria bacterium]
MLHSSEAHGLLLVFSGCWRAQCTLPARDELLRQLPQPFQGELRFDSADLRGWDSRFVNWLLKLIPPLEKRGIVVRYEGLPPGVRGLLQLATEVPERAGARRGATRRGLLATVGEQIYRLLDGGKALLEFIGELLQALFRMLIGRARMRASDLFLFVQQNGIDALPIVALIAVLVGLILAFIGALQLQMFGAQIYVANLVGIAMAREMGAMMAAIIMAGRTGAAFAAQLGTMQVNEEIDAFRTLGVDPLEFLVLPRMLALTLMMPLLCIYADLLGIMGGMLVGITLFEISPSLYLQQTLAAVSLADFGVGVVKSLVFGVLIAVAGCMQGIRCGRSASAVGEATTSAVVMAIVAIIVADAIMTLIANALGV